MILITRDQIAQPVRGPGLFLFFIQHIFFISIILYQVLEVSAYKTSTLGSFSVAEAAYITALWTQVAASTGAWIAWTLFCGVFIVANRITRLHEAYLASFSPAPAEATGPDAPRIGNHSLAGATRQDAYNGRPYTVHGDGMVVGRMGNDAATWRNEAEFKAWVDREAPSAS